MLSEFIGAYETATMDNVEKNRLIFKHKDEGIQFLEKQIEFHSTKKAIVPIASLPLIFLPITSY